MIEVSLKPNGSGIQFDNFLDKLLKDEDHRGIAHCMGKYDQGDEGKVTALIERRSKHRKGGLEVGTRCLFFEKLLDGWAELSIEAWLKVFTIRKPLEQIALRDLRPAMKQYEAERQASIVIDTTRIFDGFPDVLAVEQRLKEVLSANGHAAVDVKTRRGHWTPGQQLVTVRIQPEGLPQLEMGDDYPIPSPPKK